MSHPFSHIRNSWRKNWPEVHSALTGGMPGFIFSKRPGPLGDAVPVFCYHVIDEPTFRADLTFLTDNGYHTLTAEALLDHLEQRQSAPANSVVLSFDDGQRTLYDTAFPLLKEFNHKAVAFVCPGLHRDQDADDDTARDLCDWQQINEMHASGHVDFQPHTHSHRYLPTWPTPLPLAGVDDAVTQRRRPSEVPFKDDLNQAKQELDQRLGKNSRHLAFPQYYGTDAAIQVARELGFQAFYWGVLPGQASNLPKASQAATDRIVRLSGEFVRRLPGQGRVKLSHILSRRYGKRLGSA